MSEPRRILVRLPNWTGDVVMATPALRALRGRYPRAEIVGQVRPGLEPLLAGLPSLDRVETAHSWHRGARALWREARSLREPGFDLGVCLPDSFSSALLMRLASVREVVGFGRGGRGVLLHRAVAPRAEWGPRRLVARERSLLYLLQQAGCEPRGTHLQLATTPREEAAARALCPPGARDQPLVAIAPGASYGASKRWPVESFAAVADALAGAGARVILLGTPSEADLGRAVCASAESRPLDLCGRSDLGVLKALLRRASLLVSNDAGARHIATAFGTPSVVLFGPTAVEKTDCNLETVDVLEAAASCRPCYRRECPIDHRCMRGIAPEVVVARASARLSPR